MDAASSFAAGLPEAQAEIESRAIPSTQEGFGELVAQHQQRIFRVLVGWTGDEALADNLTQETFLRAYRARDSFRGESAVSTWLHRIAIRVAQDHDKSRRVGFWRGLISWATTQEADQMTSSSPSREDVADPERELIARRQLDDVWRVVEGLPEGQRAVFQLRFIEEMSLAEIAEVLDIREGTVKAQLHRAVHAVRKRLPDGGRV